MSERHAFCAAKMREFGTDPDGVERAMLAAGYSARVAEASRDMFADFLRKAGYDVDGAPDPPVLDEVAAVEVVQVDAEPEPDPEPEPDVDEGAWWVAPDVEPDPEPEPIIPAPYVEPDEPKRRRGRPRKEHDR